MKKATILCLFALFVVLILSGCFDRETMNTNLVNQSENINTNKELSRAEWKNILKWPAECDEPGADFGGGSGVYEYEPEEGRSVVLVFCFLTAYQDNYRLYYYDKVNQGVVSLQLTSFYENIDGELEEMSMESFASADSYEDFSQTGSKLSIVEKGAGHFGCGTAGDYEWNNDQQKYELVEMVGHFDCDNVLDADQWPVIYP